MHFFQANENRVEKIHVLLDLLPVRSNEACKKLAECLIIGGQPLLADFLLDDGENSTTCVSLDIMRVCKHLLCLQTSCVFADILRVCRHLACLLTTFLFVVLIRQLNKFAVFPVDECA